MKPIPFDIRAEVAAYKAIERFLAWVDKHPRVERMLSADNFATRVADRAVKWAVERRRLAFDLRLVGKEPAFWESNAARAARAR